MKKNSRLFSHMNFATTKMNWTAKFTCAALCSERSGGKGVVEQASSIKRTLKVAKQCLCKKREVQFIL